MITKLTSYGIDDTLKHSVDLLSDAIAAKSKERKNQLMYQVVGEIDTLYRLLSFDTEEDNHEEDNNND
jgi:hypothetical protein